MLPKWHILYSFVLAYLLVFFFRISLLAALIVFLSGVFIDLDHYFRFVILERKIHPKSFWVWSMEKKEKWEKIEDKNSYQHPIFIFHGFEALGILVILSFFNSLFFWIFIGFSFHIFLDLVYLLYNEGRLDKISQIHNLKTNKLKNKF